MKISRSARRCALAAATSLYALQAAGLAQAAVWINEAHYDDAGTDENEFIEIAGTAGTNLTGWSIVLYNGANGLSYTTTALSGVLADAGSGFGFFTINYPVNGIQNGAPDGFALVDNLGAVVQFLSYEGTFTAANGPANGLLSVDIGVSENGVPEGQSLQLSGTGLQSSDFTWTAGNTSTPGAANVGQVFATPPGGGVVQDLAIYEIQGGGHASAFEGADVRTTGIVTGVKSNGFYIQDPSGDGDDNTSDAVFVFTGGAPTVAVGDAVTVEGSVAEFLQGGDAQRLTLTEIISPMITVTSQNNMLPPAVILGAGGRLPPTQTIDSDGFATFNPAVDGIDFYESLEGVRVQLPDAQAVSSRAVFGNGDQEIYAIGNRGADATGLNEFGGVTLSETDANPERIQIQSNGLSTVAATQVGDGLGSIVGNLDYSFGDYEIVVSAPVSVTDAALNAPQVTTLTSGPDALRVATFNALLQNNFAPPTQAQIDGIAAEIVNNLKSPDIIGLQEVQRAFGAGGAQALLDAIVAAGGPQYNFGFVESVNNTTSILPAFLYTDAVTLNSLELIPGGDVAPGPFDGGQRVPLVGTFSFNGETFTIVNNHFDSKDGSSPAFGAVQPPVNGGELDRTEQAQFVNNFIDSFLATDPDANIIVLGDFNEFAWEDALAVLMGAGLEQVLTNANFLVPDLLDRFTFQFEGNLQQLDQIFLTAAVLAGFDLSLDFLHINSIFSNGASDHDPIILRLAFAAASEVPLPAAFWLMLLGLGALSAARTRRLAGAPAGAGA